MTDVSSLSRHGMASPGFPSPPTHRSTFPPLLLRLRPSSTLTPPQMPSEPPYTTLLSTPGGAFPSAGLVRDEFVVAARFQPHTPVPPPPSDSTTGEEGMRAGWLPRGTRILPINEHQVEVRVDPSAANINTFEAQFGYTDARGRRGKTRCMCTKRWGRGEGSERTRMWRGVSGVCERRRGRGGRGSGGQGELWRWRRRRRTSRHRIPRRRARKSARVSRWANTALPPCRAPRPHQQWPPPLLKTRPLTPLANKLPIPPPSSTPPTPPRHGLSGTRPHGVYTAVNKLTCAN
ncbi:hypothetical protein FB451DRAFT_1290143 [Mycena latifolia]|nr:hypothetical protein FB451DRAFT_1290143 [Mycena latifolia]